MMHSFDSFCWQLLDHCVRGQNGWSGKNGSRIDFIATHRCTYIKILFMFKNFLAKERPIWTKQRLNELQGQERF